MSDIENEKLIVANMSGFYGDRFNAPQEMVEGGPIDVLTGDYLAELTMAILFNARLKDPSKGFAVTFLKQMETIMGTCLDKGIKIVTNAGGLNPSGLAEALEKLMERLGLKSKIAFIEGDDLMPRLAALQAEGERFRHLDKGVDLADGALAPISANAYLGCWGVAEALGRGADMVITGRIADAALVMGPAAWRFGWKRDDWDRLAGAAAAGHIIECGAQATGGNYSFMKEIPSYHNVGFPIAEVFSDGSAVITKHPGTGGLVSVGTVTAQLMYEIDAPVYLTPDVRAHFGTLRLTREAENRVRVNDARGQAPPRTTKVCLNCLGGYKNTMTVVLTGLDIEKKAAVVEETLFKALGGQDNFALACTQLIRSDKENPATNEEAFAYLRISVMDADPKKAGRLFSSKVVELALAGIPGFNLTGPPSDAQPAVVHWPALIDKRRLQQKISIVGEEIIIPETDGEDEPAAMSTPPMEYPAVDYGQTVRQALGRVFAARSGDKGGNANVGIWAATAPSYAFLRDFLTTDKLRELLPETARLEIDRYEFPNLLGVNFYIKGFLGEGAAASIKPDPQAKTLAEYLRAKIIDVPRSILQPD